MVMTTSHKVSSLHGLLLLTKCLQLNTRLNLDFGKHTSPTYLQLTVKI